MTLWKPIIKIKERDVNRCVTYRPLDAANAAWCQGRQTFDVALGPGDVQLHLVELQLTVISAQYKSTKYNAKKK